MTPKGSQPGERGATARYHIDMNSIPIGAAGAHRLLVTPEVTIDFLGDEEARVLSTPHLIGYMEWVPSCAACTISGVRMKRNKAIRDM